MALKPSFGVYYVNKKRLVLKREGRRNERENGTGKNVWNGAV
jgi:hypothetical protein